MKLRKRRRLMVVREVARRIRWREDGRERIIPWNVITVFHTTEDLAHPMRLFLQARKMARHQAPKVRGWIDARMKKPPRYYAPIAKVTF